MNIGDQVFYRARERKRWRRGVVQQVEDKYAKVAKVFRSSWMLRTDLYRTKPPPKRKYGFPPAGYDYEI